MDLRQLFLSARGRIGRQTYWLSLLGLAVASAVLQGVGWAVAQPTVDSNGSMSFSVQGIATLLLLALFVLVIMLSLAGLFLAIKRCHDRDRSGWFVLVGLIPLIGGIWLLIELGFLRGSVGPNRFGPDPLSGLAPA